LGAARLADEERGLAQATVAGLDTMHEAGWVDDATAAAMAFRAAGAVLSGDEVKVVLEKAKGEG
jgi:hypothetical protein